MEMPLETEPCSFLLAVVQDSSEEANFKSYSGPDLPP